jgi:UDP-3-O-[3-hydroxymyristoyl] glucosamine N-acyltransferase
MGRDPVRVDGDAQGAWMKAIQSTVWAMVQLVGAKPRGPVDMDAFVWGTCPVENYRPSYVTFVRKASYLSYLEPLRGAVVLITPELADQAGEAGERNALLVVDDVADALISVQAYIYGNPPAAPTQAIADTAVIAASAALAAGVVIGPYATIGENATIGASTRIGPSVVVGDGVQIGARSTLHAGVVAYDGTMIGDGVLIHAGTVLGADGFRFEHGPDRASIRKMIHVGGVTLGDGVEIGANCSVDRATFEGEATVLADEVKLDSQVHVGHNAVIGARSMLAAQTCISGSVNIGEGVWIGAGATISNGVRIGDRATVLVNAVVVRDLEDDALVSGFYAMAHRSWKKAIVFLSSGRFGSTDES